MPDQKVTDGYHLPILAFCLVLLGASRGVPFLQAQERKVVTKEEMIEKWQAMFGNKVDFSNPVVFDCMVYLGPQPDSLLEKFAD